MIERFKGKTGEEYELFKIGCPHFEELENNIGDLIKEEFGDKKNIHSIEIGCGPGYTTIIALDSSKYLNVIAVDNEDIMIKQAQENLAKYIKDGKVKLILEDGLAFLKKCKSNSFDMFFSGFTLHNLNFEYRNHILKEIYRILKSGGIFVNADKYALDKKADHKKTLNRQLKTFKKIYGGISRQDLVKERCEHYLQDDNPDFLMKEGESKKIMRDIGFQNIKIIFRKQMEALFFARK